MFEELADYKAREAAERLPKEGTAQRRRDLPGWVTLQPLREFLHKNEVMYTQGGLRYLLQMAGSSWKALEAGGRSSRRTSCTQWRGCQKASRDAARRAAAKTQQQQQPSLGKGWRSKGWGRSRACRRRIQARGRRSRRGR